MSLCSYLAIELVPASALLTVFGECWRKNGVPRQKTQLRRFNPRQGHHVPPLRCCLRLWANLEAKIEFDAIFELRSLGSRAVLRLESCRFVFRWICHSDTVPWVHNVSRTIEMITHDVIETANRAEGKFLFQAVSLGRPFHS